MTRYLKILTGRLKISEKGTGIYGTAVDPARVDTELAGEGPAEMGQAFEAGEVSHFRHIHTGGGQVFFGLVQPQ